MAGSVGTGRGRLPAPDFRLLYSRVPRVVPLLFTPANPLLTPLRSTFGILGSRRTVGPALYLLLALALGGMVVVSFTMTARIERAVFQSVSTSELWAGKFGEISTLGSLTTAVDAPGNAVFLDGDI